MKLIEVLYKEWNGEWKFPKGYDSVVQDGVAPFDVYAFGTNDFYFNWNEKVWVVGGNNPVVKVLQTTKLASDYDCAIVTKRAFLEYAAQVESKQRQSQIVVFPKSRSEAEAVANKLSDMGYKWTARKAVSDISWPAGAMVTTPNNKVVWIPCCSHISHKGFSVSFHSLSLFHLSLLYHLRRSFRSGVLSEQQVVFFFRCLSMYGMVCFV